MNTLLVVSCLLIATVTAQHGQQCSSDVECGDDHCCQILSEFMVVSKRATPGTCEPYIQDGEPCDVFGKYNGFCSCYPGYSCVALEVPITGIINTDILKRKLVPPKPGYTYDITCVRDIE